MPLHIAICELYHPQIHGTTAYPPNDISTHYIAREIIRIDEFMQEDYNLLLQSIKTFYRRHSRYLKPHPIISNYHNIVRSSNYICINVVQISNKAGIDNINWCTACLNTYWIRIIQRKWKRIYVKKKRYIAYCKTPYAIRYREIHGKFPRISSIF